MLRRQKQENRYRHAEFLPAFKILRAPGSRKQSQSAFTNFIEISYAFFTNAVLKYKKSAEATADRRVR
jgi:hypothetical protein